MDTRPRHTTERLDEAIVLRREAVERRRRATPGTDEFRDAQAEEELLSKRVLDQGGWHRPTLTAWTPTSPCSARWVHEPRPAETIASAWE